MQKRQSDFHRLPVRLPPSLHEQLVNYGTDHDMSLNSAIIDLLSLAFGVLQEAEERHKNHMAIFCGQVSSENYEQSMISINDFFEKNPIYQLINCQIMPNGRGVYYFYKIPKEEDRRRGY